MSDDADLKAEIAKLGEHGPARVAAVEQFIRATTGAGAVDIIANLKTAAAIEGIESLMAGARAQRAEPPKPEPPPPSPPRADGRVDEETFEKMTPAQRIDYTRQFDQRQFQTTENRR